MANLITSYNQPTFIKSVTTKDKKKNTEIEKYYNINEIKSFEIKTIYNSNGIGTEQDTIECKLKDGESFQAEYNKNIAGKLLNCVI